MVGMRLLTKPTLGVILETGRAISVPPGNLVVIPNAPADGVRTVDVICDGRELMMFVSDLRDRSQEIGP